MLIHIMEKIKKCRLYYILWKNEKQNDINGITCDEGSEFKNSDFKSFCDMIYLYFLSRAMGTNLGY
jgi:hypothetical protein